jgi:hypothetical protein
MSQSNHTPARPANPFARRCAALRLIILDCLTDDDMRVIVRKMIELAKEGSVSAARLLFQYGLGRPTEAVSPDRVDIDEVKTFKDGACKKDDLLPTILSSIPADVGAELLRELAPVLGDAACAEFRQLSALAREREEMEQATVTKRGLPAQPAPLSDRPAEAEAIRLVNRPDGKQPPADQRAANKSR